MNLVSNTGSLDIKGVCVWGGGGGGGGGACKQMKKHLQVDLVTLISTSSREREGERDGVLCCRTEVLLYVL